MPSSSAWRLAAMPIRNRYIPSATDYDSYKLPDTQILPPLPNDGFLSIPELLHGFIMTESSSFVRPQRLEKDQGLMLQYELHV